MTAGKMPVGAGIVRTISWDPQIKARFLAPAEM
jgi:hypothetical protein